jgi:DNA-binding transcriptional ArsR family regulator
MKALLLVPAALALIGVGVLTGVQLAERPPEKDAPAAPSEGEVVFRNQYGETRVVTAAEAAQRIEQLEASLARRRVRSDATDEEAAPQVPAASEPPVTRLLRPDGRPYDEPELRELARTSTDQALRAAAIRELRRADSDTARTALREILDDKTTPAPLREEAAKALASPPNRDRLPEELVAALRAEADPAVRRALAEGVARMNERDAYMVDIVALVHGERDPEVRKALFAAVLRDARDPVARAELLAVGTDPSASIDERRAALAALPRGRTDAETVAKVAALLADPDARVRESAVAFVGSAESISPSQLAAALSDADAGVRRAAVSAGLNRLPQFANDATIAKQDVQELIAAAVRLAASDPDASVRRAAIQQAGRLPGDVRTQVIATGREDADLFVKLTAYARSPEPVAKQGTPLFVGALDSPDAGVRDFAYRQLQRFAGVTAPFDARWNRKAREDAIAKIRADLAAAGR